MTDVWVDEPSPKSYVVMVNGLPYDHLTSSKRLTHSERVDIARGYAEALEEA